MVSGHGSGLLTGSRVYLDVLGCLARSFRVLREVLLLGESRHFTLSRRGALSVARTAFFAICTTRTLSDTPGKWPIYGRTWNREPLIRRSPIFRPIIIIILFATATILAMFFGPLVVASGVTPSHWRSHTGWSRSLSVGDTNRIVSLSTNTLANLPLCHWNSLTTHPLVTLSSHSGKKILVKLIFFLTFTSIRCSVLLNLRRNHCILTKSLYTLLMFCAQ